MCVIFWVNKDRPSQYMVEKAFDHNDDGGGGAWRTTNEQGEPVVEWKKGLGVKEMVRLAAELPIPYILHFRIASIGGVRDSLTHPFPINKNGSLALEGKTKGYVLFHNGHWKEWNDECRKAAVLSNTPIPMGRWSDTRAMAWLCSIYGPGYMEFMPEQKGIVFGPQDMQIFDGNGWERVKTNGRDKAKDNDEGDFVWCSNDFFTKGQTVSGQQMIHQPGGHTTYPQHSHQHAGSSAPGRGVGTGGRFCRYGTGKDACINQTLDQDGYCFMHPHGVPRMRLHDHDKTVVMGPTQATGGSRVPPSPFVQRLPLELPPGEVISIELAEYLHKENQLSKNKLKKIRGLWEVATSPHTKAAKRAEQALRQMSIAIINTQ